MLLDQLSGFKNFLFWQKAFNGFNFGLDLMQEKNNPHLEVWTKNVLCVEFITFLNLLSRLIGGWEVKGYKESSRHCISIWYTIQPVYFVFQGSMTAMTVFFPLDTARLRLQGKCQNLVSSYTGISVHLGLGTCKGGCGEDILHEQESYLCHSNTVFPAGGNSSFWKLGNLLISWKGCVLSGF